MHPHSLPRLAIAPRAAILAAVALALACAGPPSDPGDAGDPSDAVGRSCGVDPTTCGRVEGELRVVGRRDLAPVAGPAVIYLRGPERPARQREKIPLVLTAAGFALPLRAIGPGEELVVTNRSDVHHRLFWLDAGRRVDVPLSARSEAAISLPERGVVRIYCDLHAEEYASVFVAPSHHYDLLDFDAPFVLAEVPPGEWTLSIWSEGVEGPVRTIQVEPGGVAHEDVWIDPRRVRTR